MVEWYLVAASWIRLLPNRMSRSGRRRSEAATRVALAYWAGPESAEKRAGPESAEKRAVAESAEKRAGTESAEKKAQAET